MMWMFVSFDLPTTSPEARKIYRIFVKRLKHEGFVAIQESLFYRKCLTPELVAAVRGRILDACPENGKVAIVGVPQNCQDNPLVIQDRIAQNCFNDELPISFF